ncbi:MAG: hypothetical protein Q8O33_01900 [Pseudomonadota bacterium]|nr:hypothetical protein [Pseudomonadota bacterium]
MLIAVVATLATLGLALALYQRARRARLQADRDGPRTLMPGMKA